MSDAAAQSSRLSGMADIKDRVATTLSVSAGALRRRDSLAVLLGVTTAYLLLFLWALQDLSLQPGVGFSVTVVADPLARMFQPGIGPFTYEGIAIADLWIVRLLVSPVNLAIGLSISGLVGLNIALSYLAVTQPKSCGLGASSGVLASIPALLAGSTCCAPVILLVIGVQVSSLFLSLFSILLPLGIVLLFVSLGYISGKIDPTAV